MTEKSINTLLENYCIDEATHELQTMKLNNPKQLQFQALTNSELTNFFRSMYEKNVLLTRSEEIQFESAEDILEYEMFVTEVEINNNANARDPIDNFGDYRKQENTFRRYLEFVYNIYDRFVTLIATFPEIFVKLNASHIEVFYRMCLALDENIAKKSFPEWIPGMERDLTEIQKAKTSSFVAMIQFVPCVFYLQKRLFVTLKPEIQEYFKKNRCIDPHLKPLLNSKERIARMQSFMRTFMPISSTPFIPLDAKDQQ